MTVASSASRRRQHLFLLRELVVRNLRSRYVGSALGLAWSVLNPLWQLALFTFVFFRVLELSLEGEQTQNFAVFLFCGLLPWMAVHEGVSRSASAITDNADLIKKMRLPGELLVASLVIGALLNASIGAVAFVVVLAAIGELSVASVPLILVAVPLQAALTFGLGLGLAAANAYFRDTAQAAGLVLNAWFFVTPIIYSVNGVPCAVPEVPGVEPADRSGLPLPRRLSGGRGPGEPDAAARGHDCRGGLRRRGVRPPEAWPRRRDLMPVRRMISAVIVHYRTPRLLEAAVAALHEDARTSAVPLEVVVVDNGAASASAAGGAAPEDLPAQVLRPAGNLGYAAGMNLGVKHAKGDVLLLMNADVEVEPGCLRALLDALADAISRDRGCSGTGAAG